MTRLGGGVMRLIAVFALFGVLVVAGSAALREPAGARERSDADSASSGGASSAASTTGREVGPGAAARAGLVAPRAGCGRTLAERWAEPAG